ncbi:SRPBCC family protein [Faecalibacter rhinopitheci]|uniref:SRPBCC family protein n=1 Tax=Faecalibacter rhinopitheci TaxID=2779678 RepID=A0A8J7FR07_9FLAO|nr:SRPBCC domain-containing protein [Faecalibacter rhinopitheci]MBF0598229.1 SRPBCC family protein [Faecalibacter rhinopitheci]MBQ0146966.1 SRPBCC family protein [Candidatus Onthonaster equi]
MKVNTNKVRLSKNQQDAFEFLLNMENYKQLMPTDTKSFEIHESGKGFTVGVGALPKVGMRLKETTEPSQIVFESPAPAFDYTLTINIEAIDENTSDVQLDFDGKFNMMIEMMAKKPLTSFIETIAENLGKL